MKRTPRHEIKGPGGSLPLRPGDDAATDLVMLIEGETSGRDLDEVLSDFGRSRSTYYEKLRRFREQGVEGLLARPPGPRTAWRRPIEVVRFVVTSKLRHPDRTPTTIATELEALGHTVSVRSVERTLAQFGLTRPRHAPDAGARPSKAPADDLELAGAPGAPAVALLPEPEPAPSPPPPPAASGASRGEVAE